jgi:TPR repeat protein
MRGRAPRSIRSLGEFVCSLIVALVLLSAAVVAGPLEDNSIAKGSPYAQTLVGFAYGRGEGVPQDLVYAHMWLNLAAAGGDCYAAQIRDQTARQMTLEQITRAQKLAREWRPKPIRR